MLERSTQFSSADLLLTIMAVVASNDSDPGILLTFSFYFFSNKLSHPLTLLYIKLIAHVEIFVSKALFSIQDK